MKFCFLLLILIFDCFVLKAQLYPKSLQTAHQYFGVNQDNPDLESKQTESKQIKTCS